MKNLVFMLLMLFSCSLLAETTNIEVLKEGEIIIETIDKLTKDGYITEKNAIEAKQEYVFSNPEILNKVIEIESASQNKIDNEISWTEYITWENSAYFISVIFALICFHGVILKIIASGLFVILSVPVIIYQVLLLSLSLVMTFKPELISIEHSFHLALFGSIANIIILGWMAFFYKELFKKISKLLSLGLNVETMLSFWLFLYFGLFAVLQESSAFGLLSIIFLVSVTGFVIIHMGLGIALGAKSDNMLIPVVLCNLLILGAYSAIMIAGIKIPYLEHFSIGIEYVCSLALCVCLLITSSPFFTDEEGFGLCFLLMILVSIAGFSIGTFYGLTVIAAFTNTFFVLFVIEWLLYSVKDTNYTIIMGILAVLFWGIAKILSNYSQYFITNLI
jgi:hypothetical protein